MAKPNQAAPRTPEPKLPWDRAIPKLKKAPAPPLQYISDDKERCKLLQDIPDPTFNEALTMLKRMRTAYPQYRDDELLMRLFCTGLQREDEALQDRLRGR